MLPKASEKAHSEGERIDKNSELLATAEGERLETIEVIKHDWHDQPREKRTRVTKDKAKPLRRSKQFTPEKNERLNKLEVIEEEDEVAHQQNNQALDWD